MPTPIYLVDAFTDIVYRGNPAGVCLLDAPREEQWMRQVAMEMNQAETAFVRRAPEKGEHDFDLRWFTPTIEVDLCGHATLASAFTLWNTDRVPRTAPIRFHTNSGVLTCVQRDNRTVQMDFPATPPRPTGAALDDDTIDALSVKPSDVVGVYQSRFDYFIEIGSSTALRAMKPDYRRLARIPTRGIIVTCASDVDPRHDFLSRFFAPNSGIDEDPVTGSAHCALGPFWAQRLGRNELSGHQASLRGGDVLVTVRGDRVLLAGMAVVTLRGELLH